MSPALLSRFMRPARARTRGDKMGRNTGGNDAHVRQSALWGSGNRGGELRSSALWGKGGRGLITSVVALALAMPLAASAGGVSGSSGGPGSANGGGYVSHQLKQQGNVPPERSRQRHRSDERRRVAGRRQAGRERDAEAWQAVWVDQRLRGRDPRSGSAEARADQGPRRHRRRPIRPQGVTPAADPTSSQLWTYEQV